MKHLIGNAVVGQSGGPTAAINATLAGVIRGVREGLAPIVRLYGMRNGIDGFLAERMIDLGAAVDTEDKLRLLEHTPAAALGSCRRKLPDPAKEPAVYEALLALFRKYFQIQLLERFYSLHLLQMSQDIFLKHHTYNHHSQQIQHLYTY